MERSIDELGAASLQRDVFAIRIGDGVACRLAGADRNCRGIRVARTRGRDGIRPGGTGRRKSERIDAAAVALRRRRNRATVFRRHRRPGDRVAGLVEDASARDGGELRPVRENVENDHVHCGVLRVVGEIKCRRRVPCRRRLRGIPSGIYVQVQRPARVSVPICDDCMSAVATRRSYAQSAGKLRVKVRQNGLFQLGVGGVEEMYGARIAEDVGKGGRES